jgi:hypothetical protein
MKTKFTVLLAALIALTVACSYSPKAATPAAAGAMPAISALAPDNTNAGGPSFLLTVNGANFSSKATINWNGAAQATTFVSASQLTATIGASEIANSATVPITVTNPATSGTGIYNMGATLAATSSAMNFTIN